MEDNELFEYCIHLETEYNHAFTYGINVDSWNEKRRVLYTDGPLHGLYREGNQQLKLSLDQPVQKETLLVLLKKYIRNGYISSLEIIKEQNGNKCNLKEILDTLTDKYEQNLTSLSVSNIVDWMNSYNYLILEDLKDESEKVKLRFLEIYIKYQFFKDKYDNDEALNRINALYGPILNEEKDYRRWCLIPIAAGRELRVMDSPRIYDSTLDKTVFLETPKSVVEVLYELYHKGFIGKYAFLGRDIEDGKVDLEYLQEAIEQGRLFSFNLCELPAVTKLYSEYLYSYDNQLWIRSDGNELTFEELLRNVEEDDTVKTQMIHIEYERIDDACYIKHLDHEYIFYTKDEYKIRKHSMYQKGYAKKRKKTFKVDESKIPLDYACEVITTNEESRYINKEVPFVYFIVNAFFINKDLIEEYFAYILTM